MRQCIDCKITKPDAEMTINRGGPRNLCILCNRIRSSAWYAANKERRNRRVRFSQHGITEEIYNAKLAEQGGGCAVCSELTARMHIDHDHAHCDKQYGCMECFRGVLCERCNIGLGSFQDNTKNMRSAVAYLERTSSPI